MIKKLKIKEIREERGLKQCWVANKAGIKQPNYSSYENNVYFPRKKVLQKIADVFKLSIEDLIEDERNTISD